MSNSEYFDKWKDEDGDDEDEAKPDDYAMPGMENFDMAQVSHVVTFF